MAAQDNHTIRFYIWLGFWLLLIVFGGYLFQIWFDKDRNPNEEPTFSNNSEAREVVLKRNRYGHYHVTGFINNEKVEFMLDTGATDIAVPVHMAERLGLKRMNEIQLRTANGIAKGYNTQIAYARIANIELTDLNATLMTNPSDDTVLLGMSFLKQIEFTQQGDTLILRQYY